MSSVLKLREIPEVKNSGDTNNWIFIRVTHVIENVIGSVVTGPLQGDHQAKFVEAIKKNLIKTLTALWKLKREEHHPHRLDEVANKQKFQKVLAICKEGVATNASAPRLKFSSAMTRARFSVKTWL